jgi:hypothetical protein
VSSIPCISPRVCVEDLSATTLWLLRTDICAGDLEAALQEQLPGLVNWAATKSGKNFKEYFQVGWVLTCFHTFMAHARNTATNGCVSYMHVDHFACNCTRVQVFISRMSRSP